MVGHFPFFFLSMLCVLIFSVPTPKAAVVFVLIASYLFARTGSVGSVGLSRPAVEIARHNVLSCSQARGFGATGTSGSELCLLL